MVKKPITKILNGLLVFVLIIHSVFISISPSVKAQSPIPIEKLAEQIRDLEKQVFELLIQLRQIQQRAPDKGHRALFVRTLSRGVFNEEVKQLQNLLKEWPEIYPEGLATGYFGPLTEAAVRRFQQKHNIEPIGIVGPRTRAKLNELTAIFYKQIENIPATKETEKTEKVEIVSVDIQKLTLAIYESINKQRINNGLSPLVLDQTLGEIARRHSEDQATDNLALTKPDFLCHYPIIRHEGKAFGFSLGDRLRTYNQSFRLAGENIAIIPRIKSITYKYDIAEPIVDCPIAPQFTSGEGAPEERMRLYQKILDQSLVIVAGLKPVEIVRKDWRTSEEIVTKAVEGWMNSVGHRKNILNQEFNFSGMGIAEVNDYLIITNVFLRR